MKAGRALDLSDSGSDALLAAELAAERRRTASVWLWRLASLVLFLGAWEITGRIPINPAFPPFSETFVALLGLIRDGSLFSAYLSTLQPLLIGLAISAVAGVGLGVAMGLSALGGMVLCAGLHRAAGRSHGGADPADHLRLRHRAHLQGRWRS